VGELFSVIIPTFNRSTMIAEALDSVKGQTYRPIEVIVVDDGSIDNTKDIVEAWVRKNATGKQFLLRYVYQNNQGAGVARNRGIDELHGEFVQFFDSDDRMHPDRFQKLVDLFNESGADFIQTGFDGFDPDSDETIEVHYGRLKDDLVSQALMGVLWPNTLRSAFRHSLVKRVGFWNTEMVCFEDYEYVIRSLLISKKSMVIRDVLASARRGGGERISDRLKTYEGRSHRIECERLVAELAKKHVDSLSDSVKGQFISRIYNLGVRTYASGWSDLALQCGEIASKAGPLPVSIGCLKWYIVWRLGCYGGRLYNLWQSIKR